jgi:HAD superfamily hydrolase (TIGR01459 family)
MSIVSHHRVRDIADRFDALILDLWGVVMDGTTPYDGARECLTELRARGKRIIFLSNAPRREWMVAERLAGMGIGEELYDRIVSSGEVSHQALKAREGEFANFGRRYHYLGPARDANLLDGLDYRAVPLNEADFLLNIGIADDDDTLDKYQLVLSDAAARALPMVCTNPDRVVVRHSGQRVLCAGALADSYAALGGPVHYFGKPHAAVYVACFALLDGTPRERVMAIGDSLETDISGAAAFDLETVLVLGGILAEPLGVAWGELAPPERIESLCAERGVMPDCAIPALIW